MDSPEPHLNALAQDHDLLREYAENSAESAFRALVERHGGMVYGVARRLVGDEHAAADITQSVFLALARKSSALPRSVPLAGWLHTATRYAASHWRRSEARRRERETMALIEQAHAVNADSERTWDEIAPALDAALASLSARDREAVLLRFFEQRSFSDVAAGLDTSEDAAKMRVNRAVKRLRAFLQRRGAMVNAAVLTTCLAAHAAVTAPAHVVSAASQLAGSAAAQGSSIAAMAAAISQAMRWQTIRRILITATTVAVLAGVGFWITSMPRDLTTPGAVESLLRDSTVISGEWQATPDGLAVDELEWTHLALRGPFAGSYRLHVDYRQENSVGMVELLLPAGPRMMLVVLRPAAAITADDPRGQRLSQPIRHVADIEVRLRDDDNSLSVKLDGVEIAGTKDVPMAIRRATLVPEQPRGALGLGAVQTAVVFTRLDVQPVRERR